jgi:TldD protein
MKIVAGIFLTLAAAWAQAPSDPVLAAMRAELERSRTLKMENLDTPYYIEYSLYDFTSLSVTASLGGLLDSRSNHQRIPRLQVRAGSYDFDNTNYVGTDFFGGARYDMGQLPLEASPSVLQRYFWLATDHAYKGAAEAIARKRAALKNVAPSERLPDFAHAEPVHLLQAPLRAKLDQDYWDREVRALSAIFAGSPRVYDSSVELQAVNGLTYFANTEGSTLRFPESAAQVRIRARGRAPDGAEVWDAAVCGALLPDRLPSPLDLRRAVQQVAGNVSALAEAPLAESYSGPVLFEGAASAQLFALLVGRNLGATRRPVAEPGRSAFFTGTEFDGRLGARILPEWINIVDDPTQTEWHGRPLMGYYVADMEGVRPTPVSLVEKGVLKNYLLTRQPVTGFNRSNGRARLQGSFGTRAAGFGNLFVAASQTFTSQALQQKLMEICHTRGKPYGLLISKLDFPSSASLNELRRMISDMARDGGSARPFSVPLLAYRVYPDGRRELVRGLRFRGLTSRSLKDIVAASDESFLFEYGENGAPLAMTGMGTYIADCSVVAPSVLLDDVELEKVDEERSKLPLVPAPPLASRH